MEWMVLDDDGFMRRKYSNSTMKRLRQYMDENQLKCCDEGYDDCLDCSDITIDNMELRTTEEIEEQRTARLNGEY